MIKTLAGFFAGDGETTVTSWSLFALPPQQVARLAWERDGIVAAGGDAAGGPDPIEDTSPSRYSETVVDDAGEGE